MAPFTYGSLACDSIGWWSEVCGYQLFESVSTTNYLYPYTYILQLDIRIRSVSITGYQISYKC